MGECSFENLNQALCREVSLKQISEKVTGIEQHCNNVTICYRVL